VWLLAESVNNASGFGFNGFDRNGEPKWDLLTNVNIIELEVRKYYDVL
jgi:lysophospholipid acyltransferase 1/2